MSTIETRGPGATLKLALLGGFEVRSAAGDHVLIRNHKAMLLLALLTLAGRKPVSREWLIGILWSDRAEAQARASLRQTLWELRAALRPVAPKAVVIDGETVCLDPAAATSDVERFEQLIADGSASALEAAARLYRGDLLEGVRVRDTACDAYLAPERARLRDGALNALDRLLELHAGTGASERLTDSAHRLLALDPYHEPAHRALMLVWAQHGHHDRALKHYAACRDRLRRELGVDPQPETMQLAEAVRQRVIPADARFAAVENRIRIDKQLADSQNRRVPSGLVATLVVFAVLAAAALSIGHLMPPPQGAGPDRQTDAHSASLPAYPTIVVTALRSTVDETEARQVAAQLSSRLWSDLVARGRVALVDAMNEPAAALESTRYRLQGSTNYAQHGIELHLEIVDRQTSQVIWREQYNGGADAADWPTQAAASDIHAAVEAHAAAEQETENWSAAAAFVRGWHHFRSHTLEADRLALDALTQAILLDRDFAGAHAALAAIYWRCWRYGCSRGRNLGLRGWADGWEHAERHLEHAMARPTPLAHRVASRLRFQQDRHDEAIAQAQRALALDPANGESIANLAEIRTLTGSPHEALTDLERIIGTDLERGLLFPRAYGRALFATGRFAEAAAILEQAVAVGPGDLEALELLAAAYGHLGRHEGAAMAIETLDKLVRLHWRNPGGRYRLEIAEFDAAAHLPGDRALFIDGLRLAGVPD